MRPTRRIVLPLLLALVVAALVSVRAGEGHVRPPGRTFRIAAQALGGSWSDQEVRHFATLYDLVVVGGSARPERVRLYREVRPAIQVLAYTCGFDVHNDQALWSWIKERHPDWFLRAEDGGHIRTYRNRNRYALDPGNPGLRAWFADSARRRIAELGCDGVWEDNVFPSYEYKNLAQKEKLARYSTVPQWRATLEEYLAGLQRAIGTKTMAVNQVVPWTRHGEIACVEDFPRGGRDWEVLRAAFERVANDPRRQAMLLHTLSGPDDPARAFVTASYLMGMRPGAWLGFRWAGSRLEQAHVPEYDLALGRPLGQARLSGGVWYRDFERARVLVNPGESARRAPWPGGGPALAAKQAGIAWRPGAARIELPHWVARSAPRR